MFNQAHNHTIAKNKFQLLLCASDSLGYFYPHSEAKTCLAEKRVAFVGDSRIRQLFYSYIQIIDAAQSADGRKVGLVPLA